MKSGAGTWGVMVIAGILSAILYTSPAAGELLTKKGISLEDAKKAAAGAAAEARKNNWNMAIAVVDEAGNLVYFERLDGTQIASVDIAIGKARTAVTFKRPTKALEDAINAGQSAIMTFPHTLPKEGGVPIVVDGQVVGGVGASGGSSQQDAQVAKAGVDAFSK
jgi:glc operon protein GlcG